MKKLIVLACILSLTSLLHAQETAAAETAVSDAPFNQVTVWDFVFDIGYNYRKFHKVKLFKGSDVATYYVPGTRGGGTRGPNDGVPNDPAQPWHGDEEVYDKPVHIGNADFGSRECFGSELNIGIPCFRHDALRIDGLFGFMFYECDTKLTVVGART